MFKNNFIKGEIIIKKILEKLKNIKYILGLTLLFLSLGRALFSKTTSKVQEEYKKAHKTATYNDGRGRLTTRPKNTLLSETLTVDISYDIIVKKINMKKLDDELFDKFIDPIMLSINVSDSSHGHYLTLFDFLKDFEKETMLVNNGVTAKIEKKHGNRTFVNIIYSFFDGRYAEGFVTFEFEIKKNGKKTFVESWGAKVEVGDRTFEWYDIVKSLDFGTFYDDYNEAHMEAAGFK